MMVMIGMDTADFCPMGLTRGTGSDDVLFEPSSAYLAKLEYCFSRPSPCSRRRKESAICSDGKEIPGA